MNVKVFYFAAARDLALTSTETLALAEGASIGDLAAQILRLHPALKKLRSSVKFSVNFDVVRVEAPLRDGDEVGVLPPVAGG